MKTQESGGASRSTFLTSSSRLFSTFTFTALLALLTVPHLSVAEESLADPGTSGTFEVSAGNREVFQAPGGVRRISYVLVGGRGAGAGPISGGKPAQVTGEHVFDSLSSGVLYAEAGSNAAGRIGGSNGGGSALAPNEYSLPGFPLSTGGGGGGASDLRTLDPDVPGSLFTRVAVAAGGGGAGATGHGPMPAGAGGAGGTAGTAPAGGGDGVAVSGPTATATAALGGGSGGSSAGGTAGAGGLMTHTVWNGTSGAAGQHGLGGTGGGGDGSRALAGGGGGGGGLWGGGGGGGGAAVTGGGAEAPPRSSGGAGGGAGSSFASNGTIVTDTDFVTIPRVSITYVTPGTTIDSGPIEVISSAAAQFTFSSSNTDSTFTCALDAGTAEPCSSPLTLNDLPEGTHALKVFATDPEGNFDPTPAERQFSVDTKAPVVTVTGGPEGKTREPRPTFSFTVDEAGAIAECRFDSSEFGDCDEPRTDRPDSELAAGFHSFQVRATDAAGNTSTAVSRDFEVDTHSGPDVPVAKLTFGRTVFNKKAGSAMLTVRSNVAGQVALRGTKAVTPQKKTIGAGEQVKLTVRASGEALRKLHRVGKLKVIATVRFTAAKVKSVTKSKRLTLKVKLKRKKR